MRCARCGAKNDADAGFCENCGKKIEAGEAKKTKVKETKSKKSDKPTKSRSKTTKLTPSPSDYHYGGFWIRVLARMLDNFILLIPNIIIITILMLIVFGAVYNITDTEVIEMMSGIGVIISVFIIGFLNLLYFVIMDGLGATLGKRICGLKTINQDGENLGIGRAIVRHFVYPFVISIGSFILITIPGLGPLLGMVLFMIGYIAVCWDPRKQGWHDKMAGSFVVYKKK